MKIKLWFYTRLNRWVRSKEPTLYVTGKDYAYLQFGSMRFYFHTTSDRVTRKQVVDTFSGKKTQYIIPYDGWEKHYEE